MAESFSFPWGISISLQLKKCGHSRCQFLSTALVAHGWCAIYELVVWGAVRETAVRFGCLPLGDTERKEMIVYQSKSTLDDSQEDRSRLSDLFSPAFHSPFALEIDRTVSASKYLNRFNRRPSIPSSTFSI